METVYEFTLPKGYVDNNGDVHRRGKMRLATAGDEISATRDPRVLCSGLQYNIIISNNRCNRLRYSNLPNSRKRSYVIKNKPYLNLELIDF